MLIGLDPVLGPVLLQALRAMGHGDDIVLADANFPDEATARRLVRGEGSDLAPLLTAVLSILPLDRTEPHAAVAMEVVGDSSMATSSCGKERSIRKDSRKVRH